RPCRPDTAIAGDFQGTSQAGPDIRGNPVGQIEVIDGVGPGAERLQLGPARGFEVGQASQRRPEVGLEEANTNSRSQGGAEPAHHDRDPGVGVEPAPPNDPAPSPHPRPRVGDASSQGLDLCRSLTAEESNGLGREALPLAPPDQSPPPPQPPEEPPAEPAG